MEQELDHILLDQLNCAKKRLKRLKIIKRLRIVSDKEGLDNIEKRIHLNIQFYENMIKDKTLLRKKKSKTKGKNKDILSKNVFVELYKYSVFVTFYGYNLMTTYFKRYNEKDTKD